MAKRKAAKKAAKKGSSRLENRVIAAEKHIRDLEDSRDTLAERFRKNNLLARVEALEAKN